MIGQNKKCKINARELVHKEQRKGRLTFKASKVRSRKIWLNRNRKKKEKQNKVNKSE